MPWDVPNAISAGQSVGYFCRQELRQVSFLHGFIGEFKERQVVEGRLLQHTQLQEKSPSTREIFKRITINIRAIMNFIVIELNQYE